MSTRQLRHDLRTPLSAINNIVFLLRRRHSTDDDVQEHLRVIAAQVDHATQILERSRTESPGDSLLEPGAESLPDVEGPAWVAPCVRQLMHQESGVRELVDWGCETGSRLLDWAAAGYRVTGVEGSLEYLSRAFHRIYQRPAIIQARITLVRADLAECNLGHRFPFACCVVGERCPIASDDLREVVLSVMFRHLLPGGALALALPSLAEMPRDVDRLRADLETVGFVLSQESGAQGNGPFEAGSSPDYVALCRRPA